MKRRKKTAFWLLPPLAAGVLSCGPAVPTGDCAAILLWEPSGPASLLRGELTGLLETIEVTVQAGQQLLGQQSCPYEDYRCVVQDVPAGGGRRLSVQAFGSGQQLLYRGTADSVEVKKDQLVEVPVILTPAYAHDIYPPAAVGDLAAAANGTTVTLTWTAVGDDLRAGRADSYIIKWSSSAIDEGNFDQAPGVDGPTPKTSGQTESAPVRGLPAGAHLYFALKVSDDAGNLSPISNVVDATTGN